MVGAGGLARPPNWVALAALSGRRPVAGQVVWSDGGRGMRFHAETRRGGMHGVTSGNPDLLVSADCADLRRGILSGSDCQFTNPGCPEQPALSGGSLCPY